MASTEARTDTRTASNPRRALLALAAIWLASAGALGCGLGDDNYCDGTIRVHEHTSFDLRLMPCDGPDDCDSGGSTTKRFDCADVGGFCASEGNEARCVAGLTETCLPGAARCLDDGTLQRCDELMGLWALPDACEEDTVCLQAGARAACVHPDQTRCSPGETGCAADGGASLSCDHEVGYMVPNADPPAPGLTCVVVDARPIWVAAPAVRCTPATHVPYCWDERQIVLCGDSGYEEPASCPSTDTYCETAPSGVAGCWGFPHGRPDE